jgi:hypothetical protein
VDEVSLKLIELQVAIPRTMDAGKIAAEHTQKGMVHQAHLSETNRKRQIIESKKVFGKKHTEKNLLHNKDHTSAKPLSNIHLKGRKLIIRDR